VKSGAGCRIRVQDGVSGGGGEGSREAIFGSTGRLAPPGAGKKSRATVEMQINAAPKRMTLAEAVDRRAPRLSMRARRAASRALTAPSFRAWGESFAASSSDPRVRAATALPDRPSHMTKFAPRKAAPKRE
jgi:hypothetical protein